MTGPAPTTGADQADSAGPRHWWRRRPRLALGLTVAVVAAVAAAVVVPLTAGGPAAPPSPREL